MASVRSRQLPKCSIGKFIYTSHKLAMKVADRMRHRDGEQVRLYRCCHCGQIHLGHVLKIDYYA